MGIRRHNRIAGGLGLARERARPIGKISCDRAALLAHVQAEVGCNLLVAAAARVQLETEVADSSYQFELHKVVNILRLQAAMNVAGRPLRKFVANRVQRAHNPLQFRCRENARGGDGAGVRFAGSYLLRKQPPIKCQGSLPLFEVVVQWLAKAARQHLNWCASFFCSSRARVRAGRPRIWMKPFASFWS
jgi:hypothetical protein